MTPFLFFTIMADCRIQGDPVDPGAQFYTSVIALHRGPELENDLLLQVFMVIRPGAIGMAYFINEILILPDDIYESFFIHYRVLLFNIIIRKRRQILTTKIKFIFLNIADAATTN